LRRTPTSAELFAGERVSSTEVGVGQKRKKKNTVKYVSSSIGPAAVGTTAAVSVLATGTVTNAGPGRYFRLHPDDERAEP
jgi:hypothetical protein